MFGGLRSITANIFSRSPREMPEEPMLAYFLSTLGVRIKSITPRIVDDLDKLVVMVEIKNDLENFNSSGPRHVVWNEAYRLERLLALIEPKDSLFLELNRRSSEALAEGIPTSARLKKALDVVTSDLLDGSNPPKLKDDAVITARMLLLEVLEGIHSTNQKRYFARPLQKDVISRTGYVGLAAFFAFLAPYIYLYYHYRANETPMIESWAWFPLYTAVTAGLFGAFFSRLIGMQAIISSSSLGAIRDAGDYYSILSRGIVGMCGALIVYFFLQSGLVQGSVFPDFDALGIDKWSWPKDGTSPGVHWFIVVPNQSLSLLVVWSFIAGFSERLVPNILASTEKALSDATQRAKP